MAVKRYVDGSWTTISGLQGPTGEPGPVGPSGVYRGTSAPQDTSLLWVDTDDQDAFIAYTAATLGTTVLTSNTTISTVEGLTLFSPSLTGTPIAPTASANTNTTQIATTAFVTAADNLKANLAGPTFTGTVTLPSTTSIGNVSSTEIEYIDGVTSSIQTQLNAKASTGKAIAMAMVFGG